MLTIRTRVTVKEDGTIEAKAPGGLPPGEHDATISIAEPQPRRKFRIEDFPTNDTPWDDSISLRREDMYGDDGR
jgi:hypothetical protein